MRHVYLEDDGVCVACGSRGRSGDSCEGWVLPVGLEWCKVEYDCPVDGPRWCWGWKGIPISNDDGRQADLRVETRNRMEFGSPTLLEIIHADARAELVRPQPPPQPSCQPNAWALVRQDFEERFGKVEKTLSPVPKLFVADMQARDAEGRQKYGTPLRPHNGRDMLVDAYQEALDLTVYLRALLHEIPKSSAVRDLYYDALSLARRTRFLLYTRDGK